jgi:ABC transport system ATP-binding/permease protein
LLMQGRLAFYGKPDETLRHLNATSFKDLYDKLEEPIAQKVAAQGESYRRQATAETADEWKQKFLRTPQYEQYVSGPLKKLHGQQSTVAHAGHHLGLGGAIRQWLTLSRRYAEVLLSDKFNLFILFAQAPVIALLVFFVMGADRPRDFVYFMLSLIAIWFGTSVSAREIIRERPIYKRERMVNLGIMPYLGSKLFVLGVIVGLQCLLLFLPLKFFSVTGLMPMPGTFGGIPQFWTMLLTAGVGIALGLLISAIVRTSEMATSLVPLILIPQILFAGLIGVPTGLNKAIGLFMPATWSFDTMKRYSTLGSLETIEGEQPGLYKRIEEENDKIIADARKDLSDHQKKSEDKLDKFEDKLRAGQSPKMPKLDDPPKIAEATKVPEDLSGYVTFLHPWMHRILNELVLILMFFILMLTAMIALRRQDTG